jgi:cytochrome c oxidase subunit IV
VGLCVLTLVLAKPWGIRGAAFGIAVPIVLIRGIWQVLYVSKALDYGSLKYYGECVLRPWGIAGLLVAAAYLLGINSLITNWLNLVLISALLLAAYALLAYLVAMGVEERTYVDARLAYLGSRLKTQP